MSPETHLLAGGPTDLMSLPPHFLLPSSLTRILCPVGTHFLLEKAGTDTSLSVPQNTSSLSGVISLMKNINHQFFRWNLVPVLHCPKDSCPKLVSIITRSSCLYFPCLILTNFYAFILFSFAQLNYLLIQPSNLFSQTIATYTPLALTFTSARRHQESSFCPCICYKLVVGGRILPVISNGA